MKPSALPYSPVALAEIALLTVLITVSGLFRIPSFFPGAEFQLSAPIAVAICGVFGFKKYITAGILSSIIVLLLGTGTLFHVTIAMVFRLTVGLVLLALGPSRLFYIISGPLGTIAARFVLHLVLGKGFFVMLSFALPGMMFTACTAYFCAQLFSRCRAHLHH